jgi:hypothetical protein
MMQVLQQDIDLTTIAKNDLAMITMVDPTALLQVLQWEEDELATITMVDPTSLTMADHEVDTITIPLSVLSLCIFFQNTHW